MSSSPLITHPRADSVFAWRNGQPVSAAQFLADVTCLAGQLPDNRHLLNACQDRYRFAVGLAAALITGKICLLPSTLTPETIRHLRQFAPDAACLTDSGDCTIALPQIRFPAAAELGAAVDAADAPFMAPAIDNDQTVAYVFTSGSTGVPVPHAKTWGALVRNVRSEARLWGLEEGLDYAVIGTVPPQHMYGFESTVLVVMQSGSAMMTGPHFYPADICNAIRSAPRPRILVSTPVHMRSLINAQLPIAQLDLMVSATAPLSAELAMELEQTIDAPLVEIYGSTETGQIAVRRPTRSTEWQLFEGVRLTEREDGVWASGGHVEQPTRMGDQIELVGNDRFNLHGRTADLVNIAGKRSSLAYLNIQLTTIPGVVDGAFFMPDETSPEHVTRLIAFVVAPGLDAATVIAALRQRIDSVFLPRPLVFVDALPRNATGKLPREALKALAAEKRKRQDNSAA